MNDKTLEELRYYFNGYGSRHDETILKLIDQNKRYRDSIKKAISYFNYDEHQRGMAELQKALEESE